MIRGAANGRPQDRETFARRYEPVVRAYLGARWRRSPMIDDVDDAVQEVFVECFREGGALGRLDPDRGGFRAFLYGVVRNVARRHETRRARAQGREDAGAGVDSQHDAGDEALSSLFDRAWGMSLLRQAVAQHRRLAEEKGEAWQRRLEVLRLRFEQDLPIRTIAERWGMPAPRVHKLYAQGRDDFKRVLLDVVAWHLPEDHHAVEAEAKRLLQGFL